MERGPNGLRCERDGTIKADEGNRFTGRGVTVNGRGRRWRRRRRRRRWGRKLSDFCLSDLILWQRSSDLRDETEESCEHGEASETVDEAPTGGLLRRPGRKPTDYHPTDLILWRVTNS